MPKVIALGVGGKAQAPERDDRFRRVIFWVHENGMVDRPVLLPPGFSTSADRADDTRRALFRSARYFCSCGDTLCTRKHNNIGGGCPHGGQRLSVQVKMVKDSEGRKRVQATFRDKREAIRAMVLKYGPDPSAWPYRPGRVKKEESNGHV